MSTSSPIAGHPDLAEIRQRYEAAAETPAARLAVGMTLLAGLFVALSPWITGFSGASPALALNNLVIGLAAAVLALSFAAAYQHTHGIAWTCPVLGVWTVVSVFVMSGTAITTTTVLSNVIGGVVLALAGSGVVGSAMASRSNNA